MDVKHSEVVRCSPGALWPWIDDPERSKQWLRGLEEVRPITSGPRRAGHRAVLRIREGRRVSEYTQTLLEYEPEKRFKLRMEGGCLRGMVMVVDYTLVDLGDGRTRLDYVCAAETKGLYRLFGVLFAVFGRMQVRSFFRGLKRLAEGERLAGAAK